jgi:predicted dehydrogenase
MINFNRRFWPPYQRLLDSAQSGRIGTLQTASLQLITDGLQWNRITESSANEGGALQDLGGHVVDFAVRLFRSFPTAITAVEVRGRKFQGKSLTLHWPDGRSVDCRVGYGNPREAISVTGSLGRLTLYNPHGRVWLVGSGSPAAHLGARMIDLLSMLSFALRPARRLIRSSTLTALDAFLRCVRTGDPLKPNLEDAIRIATVLAVAEESLISKKSILLAPFARPCEPRVS